MRLRHAPHLISTRRWRGRRNVVALLTLKKAVSQEGGAQSDSLLKLTEAHKAGNRHSPPQNLPDIVQVIDIQRAKIMTHQSHDEWFLEQVRQALIEADDPLTNWVPHEIVKTDMQRQREALLERILHRQSALSSPRPPR